MQSPAPASHSRRLAVHVSVGFACLVVLAGIVEVSVRGLANFGVLHAPPLASGDEFWDANHPVFGVWHAPSSSMRHRTECFDVTYDTNSIGARDRERSAQSAGRRVIVVGDSFVEGWGIDAEARLSDQLERHTGIEHMNLGMSHFGPWQAVLAYREFGPRFSHDAVLLAVVPASDFADLDLRRAEKMPTYTYRYRPYLIGEYPDYEEIQLREGSLARWLRHNSLAYNAISALSSALQRRSARRDPSDVRTQPDRDAPAAPTPREDTAAAARARAAMTDAPPPTHSFFHDYSPRLFGLLRGSIDRLRESAGERPVAVVLVPQMRDFVRYHESGTSPLGAELAAAMAPAGVKVVDLLPELYARRNDITRYFLSCEIHWTDEANAVAAEVVAEALADSFYARAPDS